MTTPVPPIGRLIADVKVTMKIPGGQPFVETFPAVPVEYLALLVNGIRYRSLDEKVLGIEIPGLGRIAKKEQGFYIEPEGKSHPIKVESFVDGLKTLTGIDQTVKGVK